ncbi:DUF3592 domain-containing protein [Myxococcota bacterium]|nr:DUF3592 domain-containing protein [Myxococcota bacterium]MBU1432780.1 DUF3592 domain-containing protein [Myxococcota bacterium]MBU1898853.1 DUF3592 domain-containing protein [Myxococcota bacterium]
MEAFIKVLIPVVLIALGVFMSIHSLRQRRKALQARSWPRSKAQVIEIKLNEHAGNDGDAQEVQLRYRYQVHDRVYEGHQIAFGYGSSTSPEYHSKIYNILRKYTELNVLYNPESPGEAVVSPYYGSGVLLGMIIGQFFVLFGLAFLLLLRSIFPMSLLFIFMVVDLLGTIFISLRFVGLRQNDPLIKDLKARQALRRGDVV